MKNAPKKIFLQIGEDCPDDFDFNNLSEVSWCEDKIFDNDIEYVLTIKSDNSENINFEKKYNDLKELVQSESVYWCLRSAVKYPSNFDFDDNGYLELFNWIKDDANN